ncbi:MAG TPA: DinB family protein [Mucilaginibacter sp.]|jgi:uncharacterized damage-inducible protein DinB
MTTREAINKTMANAKAYTKRYLDAMPGDGYDFKPSAEIRSFAQQMLHLADANYYFISIATGKPGPLGQVSAEQTVTPTKEATTKAVMDSYDFVISALSEITREQLAETVRFGDLEVPKIAAFVKAYEHQAHHRGQAVIYLRLKGIIPPDGAIF